MRHPMRILGLVPLALLVVAAADPDPEPPDPDSDAKKIEGTWMLEKVEGKGGVPADLKMTMRFDKAKVTLKVAGMEKTATYKIDARKKPRHIDITPDEDKKTVQGIYQIDGEKLKICVTEGGGARPGDFAKATSPVLTFKREKKK